MSLNLREVMCPQWKQLPSNRYWLYGTRIPSPFLAEFLPLGFREKFCFEAAIARILRFLVSILLMDGNKSSPQEVSKYVTVDLSRTYQCSWL